MVRWEIDRVLVPCLREHSRGAWQPGRTEAVALVRQNGKGLGRRGCSVPANTSGVDTHRD
jgi:hypothetical protein